MGKLRNEVHSANRKRYKVTAKKKDNEAKLKAEEDRRKIQEELEKLRAENSEAVEKIKMMQNDLQHQDSRLMLMNEYASQYTKLHATMQLLTPDQKEKLFLTNLKMAMETQEDWVIDTIAMDGNCFFASVANQLDEPIISNLQQQHDCTTPKEIPKHQALRQICHQYVQQHKQRFRVIYESTQNDTVQWTTFLRKMGKNRTWATDLEMYALEEILERNIYYYQDYDPLVIPYPPFFMPLTDPMQQPLTDPSDNPNPQPHSYSGMPIYVHHTGNYHYDLVRKEKSTGKNKRGH